MSEGKIGERYRELEDKEKLVEGEYMTLALQMMKILGRFFEIIISYQQCNIKNLTLFPKL